MRDYLAWRQVDCHINNQYNTCFWMLVKSGKTKREAQLRLKGTQTKEKNKILLQQFGINYDELPEMFKKGSCVFRNKVEEIVKIDGSGNPVKRRKNIVTIDHVDIIGPKFWDEHPYILYEDCSMVNNNYEYVKKFEADDRLPSSNWIVVRIHGCDFHRNQYNTCFWRLVKSGKTETEAQLCLEDTQEKEKNEMLFCQFGINYNKLPEMFRKGSCVFRNKVEEIVKLDEGGIPVKRCNEVVTVDHVDIIGLRFWDEHPCILHED
ncbi:hypothetical protein LUZ63_008169 [Rhynchospora breviuscula]|uniref:Thg1 C-terminal domain-containing protein n=1 Tax=Rhynchospora breviuscula TaxID=2022672 RepID=A0A9Q0HV33_9POAL|nr:hypothetical protein LUZ63_008169 [Rhynchospora breviuscula]